MNTHIKKFSEVKTHPSRALQAWQILVLSAMNSVASQKNCEKKPLKLRK